MYPLSWPSFLAVGVVLGIPKAWAEAANHAELCLAEPRYCGAEKWAQDWDHQAHFYCSLELQMWKLMDLDWLLAAKPHQRSFFSPKGIQYNPVIDWKLQIVWMWICVWAGSGAQEEIQPAAFRPAWGCCNLSHGRLGGSPWKQMAWQTDVVTLLVLDSVGKRNVGVVKVCKISGLAKRFFPEEAFLIAQRSTRTVETLRREGEGQKVQRSVTCWKGWECFSGGMLRCLKDTEGSVVEAWRFR